MKRRALSVVQKIGRLTVRAFGADVYTPNGEHVGWVEDNGDRQRPWVAYCALCNGEERRSHHGSARSAFGAVTRHLTTSHNIPRKSRRP